MPLVSIIPVNFFFIFNFFLGGFSFKKKLPKIIIMFKYYTILGVSQVNSTRPCGLSINYN